MRFRIPRKPVASSATPPASGPAPRPTIHLPEPRPEPTRPVHPLAPSRVPSPATVAAAARIRTHPHPESPLTPASAPAPAAAYEPDDDRESVELDGATVVQLDVYTAYGHQIQGWAIVGTARLTTEGGPHVVIADQEGACWATPFQAWLDTRSDGRLEFMPVQAAGAP